MINVKVVHTKETIMTSNNFAEVITQSNPKERCPKNMQYTR